MSKTIDRLVQIMARLRDPESGCPWDIEQNFETIAPYTIEEAYEVAQAIKESDMDALCDELGDLLFRSFITPKWLKKPAYSISTMSPTALATK